MACNNTLLLLAGVDRTGEMSGSYYLRWLNWTFDQTLDYNTKVENRKMEIWSCTCPFAIYFKPSGYIEKFISNPSNRHFLSSFISIISSHKNNVVTFSNDAPMVLFPSTVLGTRIQLLGLYLQGRIMIVLPLFLSHFPLS